MLLQGACQMPGLCVPDDMAAGAWTAAHTSLLQSISLPAADLPPAPPLQGPLKFYTGFPTYFIRIAPHVVFTLVFMDALPKLQKQYGL